MMKQLPFCLILICLISCRKTYDNTAHASRITLPKYSETGAGTFGCMLNDKVWTVFGKHKYTTGFGSKWLNNYFDLTVLHTAPDERTLTGGGRMSIVQNDSAITDIGVGFRFIPTDPFVKEYSAKYFSVVDYANRIFYKMDTSRPGRIQLNKFEKIGIERICSGRFSGVVYNETNPHDSIIVSDGRFDTRIIYQY